jgi:hypothetical protein
LGLITKVQLKDFALGYMNKKCCDKQTNLPTKFSSQQGYGEKSIYRIFLIPFWCCDEPALTETWALLHHLG